MIKNDDFNYMLKNHQNWRVFLFVNNYEKLLFVPFNYVYLFQVPLKSSKLSIRVSMSLR